MQIKFDPWLHELAKTSDHPFVRDAEELIAECEERAKGSPDKYGWRFSDVESFEKQAKNIRTPGEANAVFWTDQARNAEAYGLMSFWRACEVIENAVITLNRKDMIASAVLARSAIEIAATFIVNANKIGQFFNDVQFPPRAIVVSQEFEEAVVKAIWATRLDEPGSFYYQSNVLNVIQKLSKREEAAELLPTYEYLCELAHPNVIGNLRFWSHIEKVNDDGSELRVLLRRHVSDRAVEIVQQILWALSWSSVCAANASKINQAGIYQLLQKLR